MNEKTFDYCALQFLNQWLEKESKYSVALASENISDQRKGLIAAGGHFRVARNLPKSYEVERNVPRYNVVIGAIEKLGKVADDNVVDIVTSTEKEISKFYGDRNVLSLTTKFLWLKFKSPVRIYDRQARVALGTKNKDYLSFNAAFLECYENYENEIKLSCDRLRDMASYSAAPSIKQGDLNNLVGQRWFRERVLDIFLWSKGAS